VTIDDFWDPFELPEYRDLLARDDVLGVLVYPTEAEAHRRNLARAINPAYIEWGIRYVYGLLSTTSAPKRLRDQGWLIIDNTTIDLEAAGQYHPRTCRGARLTRHPRTLSDRTGSSERDPCLLFHLPDDPPLQLRSHHPHRPPHPDHRHLARSDQLVQL